MKTVTTPMLLKDALRVKSAELWLRLGQTRPALMELKEVTDDARSHPWFHRVIHRCKQRRRDQRFLT